MPRKYQIETRQKADLLFSTAAALGAAGFFTSPVRRVTGYAEVLIFAASDRPFAIQVEEATDVKEDGTGNFVQTEATIMAAQDLAGVWFVCERIRPCGNYMKMVLGNLGVAMTSLSFAVQGLPLP